MSATATAVAAVGRATAAVAPTVSELLSEPRASEHEGGSHTGVCEGLVAQRVLSASPPSQAASSAEELEELLDEPLHTTCADSAPPASMELHLWQAVRIKSGWDDSERMQDKASTEANIGARVSARHLDWAPDVW